MDRGHNEPVAPRDNLVSQRNQAWRIFENQMDYIRTISRSWFKCQGNDTGIFEQCTGHRTCPGYCTGN